MDYMVYQDTFDRLTSVYDEIRAISQGHFSDMVEARVAAASVAAAFKRILEEDLMPLPTVDYLGDEEWDAEYYPDEGKPIGEWSIDPPYDLGSPLELTRLIDPSWFCKKDGNRFKPSQMSVLMAKSLIPGEGCSSSAYAMYFLEAEFGYDSSFALKQRQGENCPFCHTRRSCVCEAAWSMNGEILWLHPDGWLDKDRKWRKHGLATIGEIQAERHPVFVCECPWELCLAREAAGYADWKNEFLAGP